ncbi:MAG: helix-turn-helix domain-containing protein [Lachnospiraceae bacterium]|nr:helix-turn-helix domain-containing protein [Lachnospiraceae bacterium]MDD7178230.1 helix-turn-helix transcriptional regulator [bacterium]MDY5518666.1 helix-turn-helix transcriptional regulator [Lachnospiraceae bacterium]
MDQNGREPLRKGISIMEATIQRIRELMKQQHISQRTLAEVLQVSRTSLNNYLTGKRWLSLDLLCQISRYLDTSTDYLLGLSNQKHPSRLPDDEQVLLEMYRTLSSQAKRCATNQLQQLTQLCRLWQKQQ